MCIRDRPNTNELRLPLLKILDTEILITAVLNSKHSLHQTTSPSDAISVTWFSIHTRISYCFLGWFVCRVRWRRCGLCTEFGAGGTPHHSVPFHAVWICFYDSCAFIDHRVDILIVHWICWWRYSMSFQFLHIAKVQNWWVAKLLFALILNTKCKSKGTCRKFFAGK